MVRAPEQRGAPSRRQPPPASPHRLHDPILARSWRALGFRSPPPPVYQGGLTGRRNLGEQPFYNRSVHLAPSVVAGLRRLPLTPDDEGEPLAVLAHEYAHVNQPRVFPRSRFEAGATIYGQEAVWKLLKALGFPSASPRNVGAPYQKETRKLFRDFGPDQAFRFAERGQFGK